MMRTSLRRNGMKRKLFLLLVVFVLILSVCGLSYADTTVRVSVDSSGNEAQGGGSYNTTISSDGRYVAFQSSATNLVENDTNGATDIFVHDMQTGATERVSVDSSGAEANGSSSHDRPSISSDGRFVAFTSSATNLIQNDANGSVSDVFVRDRQAGITNIVSVHSSGAQGDGGSRYPFISSDGTYVVFRSSATNLIQNDTNGTIADIFIHNRQAGITNIVSVHSSGAQGNSSSMQSSVTPDGRYVAFYSNASNLVDVDSNGNSTDAFVRDRQEGTTELVTLNDAGQQPNGPLFDAEAPPISDDGRYVAFNSDGTNIVEPDLNGTASDVFIRDRQTGTTAIVSLNSAGQQGDSDSYVYNIAPDGRYVVFESRATNLTQTDTNGTYDAFIHDRQTGATECVSLNYLGSDTGNQYGSYNYVSSDGRYVAFESSASNLISIDNNGTTDVFVRDRDRDNDSDTYNNYTGGDCNDDDPAINPGATEVNSDGIDQDCNGYDLTINITKADYTPARKNSPDSLKVWATSDLDAAADLVLENYSAMTWTGNRWEIVVQPAGGDPGTVTVTGIEGSESEQTK
jgi:ribosomal protein L14